MIDYVNAYVLVVRDLKNFVTFYKDKLGFKLKDKEDDFAYFVFGNESGPGLGLIATESAAKNVSEARIRPEERALHRNYLAVFLEDVDKEFETLKSKGVHFVKEPTTFPRGQRIAYFEDPEGNLWEISHFTK